MLMLMLADFTFAYLFLESFKQAPFRVFAV